MAQNVIAEWEGREYEHNPKSADWYWVLGIVAAASAIAAIIFGNYLLTVLIIIAAVTISLHSAKQPVLHHFSLTDAGLMIGDELHPFEKMLSFSVLEDIEGEFPPILSIKTENWHSPHLRVPLAGVDVDLVYAYFLHHVDEGDHPHTFTDLVAVWLGF
ncbi:MAG: hypothetical protein WCW36_00575 [Candidatus Paceibacterota bacterium]|jgi:hypothetical protein